MGTKPPAGWRDADTSAQPVVTDAVNQGLLDTGRPYVINGFANHDAANKGRMAINRAAAQLGVSRAVWVTDADGVYCWKECKDANAPHGVRFTLHSKNKAREYIARQSGGDPSKLKFNPFAQKKRRLADDDGNLIA